MNHLLTLIDRDLFFMVSPGQFYAERDVWQRRPGRTLPLHCFCELPPYTYSRSELDGLAGSLTASRQEEEDA
jgi:hypothetical protein